MLREKAFEQHLPDCPTMARDQFDAEAVSTAFCPPMRNIRRKEAGISRPRNRVVLATLTSAPIGNQQAALNDRLRGRNIASARPGA